jgi:prophage antirepressor-like protein
MTTIFEALYENQIVFEGFIIKVIIDDNDKVWFHANDVVSALGYADFKEPLRRHVDKEDEIQFKKINHNSTIKNHPQTSYLSESGLYKLILSSKMDKAKKFSKWITNEVLPSIRKFGYYKLKKGYEKDKTDLLEKINYLEKQNKQMVNDLKKNKYPDGALVYVIDYCDEDKSVEGIYRIGKTNNMTMRKKIYDTHTLHSKKVVYKYFTNNPLQFENCIRSMLYDYRYRNRKDFYICSFNKIIKAFKNCEKSIKSMNQKGGSYNSSNIDVLKKNLNKIDKNVIKYNNKLNKK